MRHEAQNLAEKAEIDKLQSELQATMSQLQAIQAELRGGLNPMTPGRVLHGVLANAAKEKIDSDGAKSGIDFGEIAQREEKTVDDRHVYRKPTPGLYAQESVRTAARNIIVDSNHELVANDEDTTSNVDVIPVSAESAGLVPQRNMKLTRASELIADAMQEERVAKQALEFLRSHKPSG